MSLCTPENSAIQKLSIIIIILPTWSACATRLAWNQCLHKYSVHLKWNISVNLAPPTWREISVCTNTPSNSNRTSWSTCATHVMWNQSLHKYFLQFKRNVLVCCVHTWSEIGVCTKYSVQFKRNILVNPRHTLGVTSVFGQTFNTQHFSDIISRSTRGVNSCLAEILI